MNKIRMPFGYKQKGNRYYWERGATTNYTYGFKSKSEADRWIVEEREKHNIEWTLGFLIRLKNQDIDWQLVDKKGIPVKY